MERENSMTTIELGGHLDLETFMKIVRGGARVEFSEDYRKRVEKSRMLVEQWVEEERVMYGVTTGFGALCTQVISKQQASRLQKNILLSHAVSVGEPFTEEETRAVMLMVLQNLGQGYSGVRMEILELYREFLNRRLVPFAPKDGSVGYLSPEAHMALTLIGEGKASYRGKMMPGGEALEAAGLKPVTLAAKEGLALVSGTTAATGMAAIALYDTIRAAKAADIIAALSLESIGGVLQAFDDRVMRVRPHRHQRETAARIREILKDSPLLKECQGSRLQDALSFRCIPQLHGAVKKTLYDALTVIETEMNSCCDNPIIWPEEGEQEALSACNADSSYIGIEMDSVCIAAVSLAKMSERRNNRVIDEKLSGYPFFLVKEPGLNSGLMVPQYTQAGLLNEMRVLCSPASVDNTSTCGGQEDYVAMGYTGAKKAGEAAEKLEYILAIELLSAYETQQFTRGKRRGSVTERIFGEIGTQIPLIEEDVFLYPHIEYLREMIHSGRLLELA